jgi:repressor LexA
MRELTGQQEKVMDFLRAYARKQGFPPTMREIGEELGFSWPAARGHLKALERKGYIRIMAQKSRGIEILDQGREETLPLPLVGDIRAGSLTLAVEEYETRIAVDKNLFNDEEAFVLRVTGESMTEAGIFDGDFVVVSPSREVARGETGVALVGDEATLKRIYREGETVTLVPANSTMSPVSHPAVEVRILGRVTGVIRKL